MYRFPCKRFCEQEQNSVVFRMAEWSKDRNDSESLRQTVSMLYILLIGDSIMLKKKQIVVAMASLIMGFGSMYAFAATNGDGSNTVSPAAGQPYQAPSSSGAAERKTTKANSEACKQKTEANDREKKDDADHENADSNTRTMTHDSHADSHHGDSRHDDLVRADHDREAIHETERQQVCGEIDDNKDIHNEHDDKERQREHDTSNKNSENQQRR